MGRPTWVGPHGLAHMGRPTWVWTGPWCPCPLDTSRWPAAWFPSESSAQPNFFLANTGLKGIFLIEDEWGYSIFVYLLMVLTGPGPAAVILGPVSWRWWSWVWARRERKNLKKRKSSEPTVVITRIWMARETILNYQVTVSVYFIWILSKLIVFVLLCICIYTYFGRFSD